MKITVLYDSGLEIDENIIISAFYYGSKREIYVGKKKVTLVDIIRDGDDETIIKVSVTPILFEMER